jgi:hypothetical protein
VAGIIDGGAADVHADLSRFDGVEGFLFPAEGVVYANGHDGPFMRWFSLNLAYIPNSGVDSIKIGSGKVGEFMGV